MVDRHGSALISDLSRQFGVSSVTIRADINSLCNKELLVRSHGGAFRRSDVVLDAPLEVKASLHHEEKVRIAQAAAALVKEGEANAAMIRIARSVTVVTDASKIGRRSLCIIAAISAVHRIITDRSIQPEHRDNLIAKGVEVVAV